MIRIDKASDCCGCNACAQICPRQSIAMQEDAEGFTYPVVDQSSCNDCGLCEKVCPVINQGKERVPLSVYAAKNRNDEIRLVSSSGGFFTVLAEKIIAEKGVVFGARFNKGWGVVHDFTESFEGLAVFRGSKYLQSQIGEVFSQVAKFLKDGRTVLFTGTPCQVSGLRLFLGKEHKKLLTADFVCHGVPSPKVWRAYLGEVVGLETKTFPDGVAHSFEEKISDISFRDKIFGWKNFSLVIQSNMLSKQDNPVYLKEVFSSNYYMKGFLQNLYLRPSCYFCPSRDFKSGSDVTFADYWGVQDKLPSFDDDKGVSLVIVNSAKGLELYSGLALESIETSLNDAMKGNPFIKKSAKIPVSRAKFFFAFNKKPFSELVSELTRISFFSQLKRLVLHYGIQIAKKLGLK